MKNTLNSSEFLQALGQLVLDFSFIESALEITIATLCRSQKLGRALTPPSNTASQNLELIQRLCLLKVDTTAQDAWLDMIADLRSLFDERNRLFHGSYYETDTKLLLYRRKKGKHGKKDNIIDTNLNLAHLLPIHNRTQDRRRQLMDFVDDFLLSDKGVGQASQSKFPSLSFGSRPQPLQVDQ